VDRYGAPKSTPPAVIETLNKQINAGLVDATIKQRFDAIAADAAQPLTPSQFGQMMAEDVEKWSKVIKFAGIKPG
jgi:tripartite-type tricarboxylate transporter receptor subunit TctC